MSLDHNALMQRAKEIALAVANSQHRPFTKIWEKTYKKIKNDEYFRMITPPPYRGIER